MSLTRRRALALACSGSLCFAQSPKRQRIRLGGPIFLKSDDPDELAREYRRLGYSAAYCPAASHTDTARIRAIESAFAKHDVVIAEVGAWVNLLDPVPEKRAKNLQYVTDRCALADQVGARCCVDIAGSFHPEHFHGFHPRNVTEEYFDLTVENCRKIIDSVKPTRTFFTIEMQVGLQPEGPDEYLKLIRAVDRKRFAVHLDVCNGINQPNRFYRNADFIRECFRKL
jgi:sugar phosphate isomerase/epimerase